MRDYLLVTNTVLVNSLQQGAVSCGGELEVTGVDSQMLLHRSGLEVGVRVNPHIGVLYINEDIGSIVM